METGDLLLPASGNGSRFQPAGTDYYACRIYQFEPQADSGYVLSVHYRKIIAHPGLHPHTTETLIAQAQTAAPDSHGIHPQKTWVLRMVLLSVEYQQCSLDRGTKG